MLHLRDRRDAERLAAGLQPLTGLLEGKYWVDELYDRRSSSARWPVLSKMVLRDRPRRDRHRRLGRRVPPATGRVRHEAGTLQQGFLQGYAAAMLFGVVAILLLVFI